MSYRLGLLALLIALSGCQTTPPSHPLTNTHWQLRQIDGTPITAPTDQPAPFLWLLANDYVLDGAGGCNRLGGVYQQQHRRHSLQLRLFAIKRACLSDFGQEQQFLQRLEDTTSYQIRGSQLLLRGKDQRTHLLFEAKPTIRE